MKKTIHNKCEKVRESDLLIIGMSQIWKWLPNEQEFISAMETLQKKMWAGDFERMHKKSLEI